MTRTEARLRATGNVLIVASTPADESVIQGFRGQVVRDPSRGLPDLRGKSVYVCGEPAGLELGAAARVLGADPGRVPVDVHGLGVYFRRYFEPGADYFRRIRTEHAFQALTESNKPGVAHRTGIYLTPVTRQGEELHFRLLRCSTNLSGPTESFRESDARIVAALNEEAGFLFEDHAPLNHVLAQTYRNTMASAERKQTKARISAHADKTKDMPANGIMAFCTFYDGLEKLKPLARDPFDFGHKGTSGLTRLHFRLKAPVAGLPAHFTLTLYPDSVFFMPLSTNRLYTHEIQSSMLHADVIPTRLGYVVRCSRTEAVHRDGHTYLKRDGGLVPLEPPTAEGMRELRRLYAEENKTQGFIDYEDRFLFSMNSGDYLAPES